MAHKLYEPSSVGQPEHPAQEEKAAKRLQTEPRRNSPSIGIQYAINGFGVNQVQRCFFEGTPCHQSLASIAKSARTKPARRIQRQKNQIMITTYALKEGHLVSEEISDHKKLTDKSTVWIDLVAPTADEIASVEKAFQIELPTPDEMKEIEISSRLYQEGRAQIMTSSIVYRIDTADPQTGEVAFVVLPETLITVRFAVPRAFQLYSGRAQTGDIACTTPTAITIGLIEAIIERQADLIERLQHQTEVISHQIFEITRHDYTREKRHAISLKEIGKVSVTASRVRDSLVSLSRLLTYFRNFTMEQKAEATVRQRIKTAQQDVQSLGTYVDHISSRLTFLMDATIGLIGIEQNQIIKLFSVAAVMLMPPTLIASVYGMNFKHMPELDYTWSYPVVIGTMIVSAIVPFIYFKYKGWF